MKISFYFFMLILVLMNACNSMDDDMNSMNESGTMETMSMMNSYEGIFVSDAHPTSGMVSVNKEQSILNFTNFKTDEGPKLLVYLSSTVSSEDYVSLGDLKGESGNYEYGIPSGTNLGKYKYVVIWCVDFSVSFGNAELK
jgi:hypothetical protein